MKHFEVRGAIPIGTLPEGVDAATGIPYKYEGPVVLDDNTYFTKFHTDEAPLVVTLCGSTRFKDFFVEAAKLFTNQGWIVLTVGSFPHTDQGASPEDVWGPEVKEMLDRLHKQKIDLSCCIYVVGDGYVGESTASEILHAQKRGIRVFHQTTESVQDVNEFMRDV